MHIRHLPGLLAIAVLAGAATAGAENSVSLTPAVTAGNAGDTIELALEIDFDDPAIGGGLVVEFDPAHLAFQGFSFDASSPDDPSLRLVCPSPDERCTNFSAPGVLVAFAVDTIGFPAISGPHTLGRLHFDLVATASSTLSTREDVSVAGPLVGVTVFGTPTLGTAQVVPLGVSRVPALGLFGATVLTGLLAGSGVLRGLRRLQRVD
jgi:hypothetical protein